MIWIVNIEAKFINTRYSSNFMDSLWNQGRVELKVLLKNGTIKDGSQYYLHFNYFPATGETYDGYDLLGLECLIANYNSNTFQTDGVDKIYADIYARDPPFTNQKYNDVATRLVFRVGEIHHDSQNNQAYIDINGELDTIETILDWA